MTPLAQSLQARLAKLPGQANCWWLAVSGGLDSMCLLHLVKQVQLHTPSALPNIRVVHINHGLQNVALDWQQMVEQQAQSYGFPCHSERVTIDPKLQRQQGIEAAARTARYQVFEKLLQAGDVLLLAQHADDQAETVLLRLLRGAGVAGLAAMPEQRLLGAGSLLRPLLSTSRAELSDYAQQQQLQWIEDPSNTDVYFGRNYLRQKVVPLLKQRWPSFLQRLQTTSAIMADSQALLQEIALQDYQNLVNSTQLQTQLPVPALLLLSRERRHNLLRWWLHELGDLPPDYVAIQQIDQQVLNAAADAQPSLSLAVGQLRRAYDELYWLSASDVLKLEDSQLAVVDEQTIVWQQSSALSQPLAMHGGVLKPVLGGLRLCEGDKLSVSLRQGGERCRPQDREHSQSLKKLLQEAKVPAWQRHSLPLFWVNGELAMVGGLWVCHGFASADDSLGWRWCSTHA